MLLTTGGEGWLCSTVRNFHCNPKGRGLGKGWGFDVLDYPEGEHFDIVYPPQGRALLTYYVCLDFCTHWLHLPHVENFEISDHMLCTKGVDFDISFPVKC
jgi:hypothetical protein